jgi:hypothetical protein
VVRLVSRRHHFYGLMSYQHRHVAVAFAGAVLLGGCGSVSVLGSAAAPEPVATGSIAAVDIQQPLPQRLAYSDATKIGQAAAVALRDVDGSPDASAGTNADWVNAATGSSGTVVEMVPEEQDVSGACRLFNTIVTSFSGVHRYTGRICRGDGGRPVVQLSDSAALGDG